MNCEFCFSFFSPFLFFSFLFPFTSFLREPRASRERAPEEKKRQGEGTSQKKSFRIIYKCMTEEEFKAKKKLKERKKERNTIRNARPPSSLIGIATIMCYYSLFPSLYLFIIMWVGEEGGKEGGEEGVSHLFWLWNARPAADNEIEDWKNPGNDPLWPRMCGVIQRSANRETEKEK